MSDHFKLHPTDRSILEQARQADAVFVSYDSNVPGGGPTAVRHLLSQAETDAPTTIVKLRDKTGMPPDMYTLSPEGIQHLSTAAATTSDECRRVAEGLMNPSRAKIVKDVRIAQRGSWRYVAAYCYEIWFALLSKDERAVWRPYENQIMGMALCEAAARMYGEDYFKPPWN